MAWLLALLQALAGIAFLVGASECSRLRGSAHPYAGRLAVLALLLYVLGFACFFAVAQFIGKGL